MIAHAWLIARLNSNVWNQRDHVMAVPTVSLEPKRAYIIDIF